MTNVERICRVAGLVPTRKQLYAAEFLESRGYQFCVTFGLTNCETKAAEAWCSELRLAELRGAWAKEKL